MAAALTKLRKHMFMLFIDTTDGLAEPTWARVGKSTIFELTLNAETVTNDYIEDENATDEVTGYKPTMSQELQTIKGDPAYDFMEKMFRDLPIGEAVKHKTLLLFPNEIAEGKVTSFNAWQCNATLIPNALNTVDQKITFDITFSGTIERGTATVAEGKPTFVPAE